MNREMAKKFIPFFFWMILIGFPIWVSAQTKMEDLFREIKIQAMKEVRKAPEFRLENLEGKTIEFKRLKGKVVFLNFWATWCTPCKEEMPSMEVLHKQFNAKDFILLAVSVESVEKKTIKEFIEKRRYTFPVLVDPKGMMLDLYGVRAIPTTFIIDKKGVILGKAIGPRQWDTPEVISLIHLLIEKKGE